MRYHELIEILSGDPVKLSLRKLTDVPPNSGDFRSTLKDIQHSGECHFILDCDWHDVYDILHQVYKKNSRFIDAISYERNSIVFPLILSFK